MGWWAVVMVVVDVVAMVKSEELVDALRASMRTGPDVMTIGVIDR